MLYECGERTRDILARFIQFSFLYFVGALITQLFHSWLLDTR